MALSTSRLSEAVTTLKTAGAELVALVHVRKSGTSSNYEVIVKVPFTDVNTAKQVAEEIANKGIEVK